jgi:diketogulonate reductase-like aldo/keto reductase
MPATIAAPIPVVELPDGASVPALGQGTWRMGEDPARARREVAALSLGIDLGMTLIDTAEMYGDGGAERIVAQAVAGRRDEVFVVSKVYPHHAGRDSAVAACERSLKRLRTDRIDLYLLHWRGRIPLAETVDAFEKLRRDGKIVRWGVSNLDLADMRELVALAAGDHCAADQVLWHLGERGIEWELRPWLRASGIPVIAYSPLDEGRLLRARALTKLAATYGATPAALALGWLLNQSGTIVIPQTANRMHVRANRAAAAVVLDPSLRAAIDNAFPPPSGPSPLATS